MKITISVDDEVLTRAEARAEKLGTSVNQLIREYLEQLAAQRDAGEFLQLSQLIHGDSGDWKFNRDELHERR